MQVWHGLPPHVARLALPHSARHRGWSVDSSGEILGNSATDPLRLVLSDPLRHVHGHILGRSSTTAPYLVRIQYRARERLGGCSGLWRRVSGVSVWVGEIVVKHPIGVLDHLARQRFGGVSDVVADVGEHCQSIW